MKTNPVVTSADRLAVESNDTISHAQRNNGIIPQTTAPIHRPPATTYLPIPDLDVHVLFVRRENNARLAQRIAEPQRSFDGHGDLLQPERVVRVGAILPVVDEELALGGVRPRPGPDRVHDIGKGQVLVRFRIVQVAAPLVDPVRFGGRLPFYVQGSEDAAAVGFRSEGFGWEALDSGGGDESGQDGEKCGDGKVEDLHVLK